MDPSVIAAIGGWGAAALVAVGAWLYSMRQAGKREELERTVAKELAELNDESVARHNLEQQLQAISREFKDAKTRHATQLMEARQDVASLEHDLSKCTTPGARRERLNRVLEKLAKPASTGSPGLETPPPVPPGGAGAQK